MVKRTYDIVAAAVLLLLGAPLLLLLGVCVAAMLGRPVLFSQARIGRGGRTFRMFKFRSMSNARDTDGRLLPDAERLGRFGTWLRSTSLDELPELFNVLRGDMSMVGPRPLLPEYLPLYSARQARRHEVRPGITGWAQVNGRNAITWERKFELDLWYVEHGSMWLDLRILALTLARLFSARDVNSAGSVTAERFRGIPGE